MAKRVKNMMKLIEKTRKNINSNYDLNFENIMEIQRNSADEYILIGNLFYAGYAQGAKAERVKFKNRHKNNPCKNQTFVL